MATLILTSGEQKTVTPADGRRWTLAELQALVGGYVELVPVPAGARAGTVILANEDGLALNLARNLKASTFAQQALSGNVLVLTADEWRLANE